MSDVPPEKLFENEHFFYEIRIRGLPQVCMDPSKGIMWF